MLKSMTGFGKAVFESPTRKVTVEIKSLNSKQADISVKMPSLFKEKETEVRAEIARCLDRGKIDCIFHVESAVIDKPATIQSDAVRSYYAQLKPLVEELGLDKSEMLSTIMRLPETITYQAAEIDQDEWQGIWTALKSAITQMDAFRTEEGARLEKDIVDRVNGILSMIVEVEKCEGSRLEGIRNRIRNGLSEFFREEKVDMNRFEQELVYYIEKLDFTEEKTRLTSHCEYFFSVVKKEQNPGRKLAFISQEMGREINTLGSKANHAAIQKHVVAMKDELEKIKEQLLNIL